MADPTPTPTPTPTPATHETSRGQIDQSWLDELQAADSLAATAAKSNYAATLAIGGIDATKVTALTAAIAAARKLAGLAIQGTNSKHTSTTEEEASRQTLISGIQEVQKRARQKYDGTNPSKLADYAIGHNRHFKFYSSRSQLEQTAANILLKLNGDPAATPPVPPDVLPGIDAAKITALQQAADDYQSAQGDQTGAQSDATTARRQLELALNGIAIQRREIQFAADAEWPHTDPANAGIRAEFQLPSDRVMK
jgi:hypothetical protein